MKIGIGTAQLSGGYGISSYSKNFSQEKVNKLIDLARSLKIKVIDTAVGYGDSEEKLGRAGVSGFKIVTKIPPINFNSINLNYDVDKYFYQSLKLLKIDKIYGVLFHRSEDLLSRNGRVIYNTLHNLKKKNLIIKIGISIYSTQELEKIIDNFEINLVQVPVNLFDNKLIKSGWLEKLKNRNVEIHARSLFLQGLLLMNKSKRPKYFQRWKNIFNKYDQWLETNSLSKIEGSLMVINNYQEIDHFIIGFDNSKQLLQTYNIINSNYKKTIITPEFNCDVDLINPSTWSI